MEPMTKLILRKVLFAVCIVMLVFTLATAIGGNVMYFTGMLEKPTEWGKMFIIISTSFTLFLATGIASVRLDN